MRFSRLILEDIHQERIRAHEKHGDRSIEALAWDAPDRLPILVEEVGEVAEELIEKRSLEHLRAELIQTAAVAAAWADAVDMEISRRTNGDSS